ncbi:esterase/lipase family protein [Sphingorhabdus sp.]|uniref:esterase/lipase family protein n=1 Tax=Sphingorhabdus sp. TaxID=1902408 RepID=UPI0039837495
MTSIAADRLGTAKSPSLLLAVTEFARASLDIASLPFAAPLLLQAPKGDGHPVLLLPGFMAGEGTMKPLYKFLKRLGYAPYQWDLGRNLGQKAIGSEGEKMVARLDEIYAATGRKVTLIGWSLGGSFARMLSRRRPEIVRQVISLGAPIKGSPKATNAWMAFQMITGQKINGPQMKAQVAEGHLIPPVPATAIFSRNDGIVAWRNAREPEATTTDNIEVRGSHCGLGVNPAVWWAIADRLALPEDGWKRFDRSGSKGFAYPSSGH